MDYSLAVASLEAQGLPLRIEPLILAGLDDAIRSRITNDTHEMVVLKMRERIDQKVIKLGGSHDLSNRFFDAVYKQILARHEAELARRADEMDRGSEFSAKP
jgi:hypothetical protein